jgi:hypothetical protein
VTNPRCAVCFTTDAGYLVPTLVAAAQARRWSRPELAEVIVFAIGLDARAIAAAAPAIAAAGIRLQPIDAAMLDGCGAMLARLFLHRLVAPDFAEFLYLDADIQVVASLDPLLATPVPSGQVRAALDPMAFRVRRGGRDGAAMAARMRAAHVPPHRWPHYFNSGVLHIARDGWRTIAEAALALHRAAPAGQPFPDQDALNIAAADRAVPMSLAWNFPIFLRNAGLDRPIHPAVLHFMARPKPWNGNFPPWSVAETAPYLDLLRTVPQLAPYLPAMPIARKARYAIQQRIKRALEAARWGRGALHAEVLDTESEMPALGPT